MTRSGATLAQAVALLAEELNDENVLLSIARAVDCEAAERLAMVLDACNEPALADFLRTVHPQQPRCVMNHHTGDIAYNPRQRTRLEIRPSTA